MKVQKLWFVRHGGRVSGPFPAKLISQDWILGRFQASDEASVDRVFWAEIKDIPELQPHITQLKNRIVGSADAPLDWEKERREAALRWVDERHQADRRDQAGPQPPASIRITPNGQRCGNTVPRCKMNSKNGVNDLSASVWRC
jgi:hypothetical protein